MRLTFFLIFCSCTICAQQSLFDSLWLASEPTVIEMDTDWKYVLRRKHQKEYLEATLTIAGQSFPGRVRSRGHARLQACRYPSLKVKLKKKALIRAGYLPLNDLKFVLQCSGSNSSRAYLRRERLLYDLYATLSPYHHRTLPVRVAMATGDTLEGFLIESEEQLEARYSATVHEGQRVSTRALDRVTYAQLSLFNYMILNTDWNVFNLHNVECLRTNQPPMLIPLPYDFDYSGLVATHYAVPREDLDMTSISEPRFLGRHLTAAELEIAAQAFLAAAPDMLRRLEEEPEMEEHHRRLIRNRMNDFFEELGDKDRLAQLAVN